MKKYKHPNFENIASVPICQLKHVDNPKLLLTQTSLLSTFKQVILWIFEISKWNWT